MGLIAGLVGHPVQNVSISNVSVEYRGGLKLQDAIDQRQITLQHQYTAYQAEPATESITGMVNGSSADHNEELLPRISWDPQANGGMGAWINDPYNVPAAPREYPEPSMFGILPAYGLYAHHVQGLTVRNVQLTYGVEDERPPVVLDDVRHSRFAAFSAMAKVGTPDFVMVTNTRKREAEREFVLNQPYHLTTMRNIKLSPGMTRQSVTILRPSPGTPPDDLYQYPTVPDAAHPYAYAVPNGSYQLLPTIHPAEQLTR